MKLNTIGRNAPVIALVGMLLALLVTPAAAIWGTYTGDVTYFEMALSGILILIGVYVLVKTMSGAFMGRE